MKQRILILAVTLAACSFSTDAQTGGTSFGIRAGVNFQNLNGKNVTGEKLDYKMKTGFHAGVTADIPVAPDYYVQPGLLFSTKGAKLSNDTKVGLSYIELPINFLYKPVLADGRLLLGFGPYAAFAVDGKYKPATGSSMDIDFGSSGSYKRFDAGANFLAGYELNNKLSLQLNAQLGLLNINHENEAITNDKTAVKNTGFGVSLGYRL
jgi:hypothetical protein